MPKAAEVRRLRHTGRVFGPSFDYAAMPELVGGRQGHGPLWIAWDTNILSLYERHGLAMWDGDDLGGIRGADPAQVEALGDLVTIWMWWDLRFIVLGPTGTDARKPPPEAIRRRRIHSIAGLARALSLGLDGEGGEPDRDRDGDLFRDVLDSLPEGHDRLLVERAFTYGADVFLTTDKGILKRADDVAAAGMRCLDPITLRAALLEVGVPVSWGPTALQGLAPDLSRMSALLEAFGGGSDDASEL